MWGCVVTAFTYPRQSIGNLLEKKQMINELGKTLYVILHFQKIIRGECPVLGQWYPHE